MADAHVLMVEEANQGERVDVAIARSDPNLSRSRVQALIASGLVTVNGSPVKANYKLKSGDKLEWVVPDPEPLRVEPQPIELDILYEDDDIIVVNKPQGMVVHPAAGNYSGTLVNALLYHCSDLSGINGVLRPGIVHRIDKDTSGVLVVAKNDFAHESLAQQIKNHSVKREYVALVHGVIHEPAGMVDAPIGRDPKDRKKMAVTLKNSKHAVTHYRVLERFPQYTLIRATLETGRTHQVRVHMAYLGHPLVGDPKYGPRKPHFDLKGQALHARKLGFKHPRSGEYMEFEAPLPEYLQKILAKLKG